MATRFNTSASRLFWSGWAIGIAADLVLAFVVIVAFFDLSGAQALMVSGLALVAWYAAEMIVGLWRLLKGYVLFEIYDKEARIGSTVAEFNRREFPDPGDFYADPMDYLTEVANSEGASNDAKFLAAVLLGATEAQRTSGRWYDSLTSNIVLERAIARYAMAKSASHS